MAELIFDKKIFPQAKKICGSGQEVYLAVSFWSGGAAEALGINADQETRVVLDVASGGTCPFELEKLMDRLKGNVRVHEDLHAKIYASKALAIVGSANASRPGLHLKCDGHAEAAVLLDGKEAGATFDHAKELFDGAERATAMHINICRERFGKTALGETGAASSKKLPFLKALRAWPSEYGRMPLIITDEETSEDAPYRASKEATGYGPDIDRNPDEWDNFNWKLNERYVGELCLALHRDPKGIISIGLVQPLPTGGNAWSFAQRCPWGKINGLEYSGTKLININRSTSDWNNLNTAIDTLPDVKGEYKTVYDLIDSLGWN